MTKVKPLLLVSALFVLNACGSMKNAEPKSSPIKKEPHRAQILTAAKSQLGTQYLFGGNKPGHGFDCSGLVEYTYAQAGIKVPRTSRDQAAFFKTTDEPKVGDLIFFKVNGKTVSHVGIYMGDNKMLHAPSSGKAVEVTQINDYWQKRFYKYGSI